jgi:hypothetical protein
MIVCPLLMPLYVAKNAVGKDAEQRLQELQ